MTSRECSVSLNIIRASVYRRMTLYPFAHFYGTRSQENGAGQVQMDLQGEEISSAGENDCDGGVFSAELKPPHNR